MICVFIAVGFQQFLSTTIIILIFHSIDLFYLVIFRPYRRPLLNIVWITHFLFLVLFFICMVILAVYEYYDCFDCPSRHDSYCWLMVLLLFTAHLVLFLGFLA